MFPRDSGAVALGADEVAGAIALRLTARAGRRHRPQRLARRCYWLEPMVEVATPNGRVGLRPREAARRAGPVRFQFPRLARWHASSATARRRKSPSSSKQTRLTFARCGITDPLSLDDYNAHGGLPGLEGAVAMAPAEIVRRWLRNPACAAVAARASRPASNGRPRSTAAGRRNTSSATRTRATAAPSPTA